MRVLVIDQDRDIISFLRERLEEKCFVVDGVFNALEGMRMAKANDYDLIIVAHPVSGQKVCGLCKELRSQSHTTRKSVPIIIASEENDIPYKIQCLNHGADDYVLKPFFFDELFARMQAILRRPFKVQKKVLVISDLSLDTQSQKLTRGKRSIYLTKKEYLIIEYLMRHPGIVMSRSDIVEHVWDIYADPFSNMIEMHMVNLRKKIHRPSKLELIHCITGRGYKIDIEK